MGRLVCRIRVAASVDARGPGWYRSFPVRSLSRRFGRKSHAEEGWCELAGYDSPGYQNLMPGLGDRDSWQTAPGSAGITAAENAGVVVGSPVVSSPFASVQVPGNMPRLDVLSGDTCAMSSDAPVPAGGDPMSGLSLAQVTQTGAGQGSPRDLSPTTASVPSLAAQAEAARRPA